jgi:DNA-binding LytR/AlgR family response regulator
MCHSISYFEAMFSSYIQTHIRMKTPNFTNRIVVTDRKGNHYIYKKKVAFIEAARSYCCIHYMGPNKMMERVMASRPMSYFIAQLPEYLLRVHRGWAVNHRYIIGTKGRNHIVLSCTDTPLKASKDGIRAVRRFLSNDRPADK